jgi:hypothetical protein
MPNHQGKATKESGCGKYGKDHCYERCRMNAKPESQHESSTTTESRTANFRLLGRILSLWVVAAFLVPNAHSADSVTVTFRYVDTTGRAVRCYVPGDFNNWGPQSVPSLISPGAVSQMQFSALGGYFWKSIRLAVGESHAYKFYVDYNSAAADSDWLQDPLNPLTDGSQFGNSLLNVQPIFIFEPQFQRNPGSSVVKVVAGCFATAQIAKVILFVDSDSTDITSFYDAGTGLVSYVPPQPIGLLHPVRLVVRDSLGRQSESGATGLGFSNRKLNVTFLFHANQNLVPYGKVADHICFLRLLSTLRGHPHQKFMIHFSGTLIHDLQWFGDSTLQILRAGIEDGQFEIMGSTYVQNVMYSTRMDSTDFEFNDHQIKIHKQEIQRVLGVIPKAFWNAERVWTQNFVQLLADNGYLYVPIEDHILQASGATGSLYQVRSTEYNGRQMTVFEDDKEFLALVDNAINSNDPSPVINFLNQKFVQDTAGTAVIGYYQDAEATGLVDYGNGVDPETNFRGLDVLLTALENDTLINVTTCSTYMQTHSATEHLPRIVDGAADWMGSDAWFSENMRPEFQMMRSVYDNLRKTLDSVATVITGTGGNTSAASALLRHAWFTLCAHQFEFGCHTLEGDVNHTQLQLARTAVVSAQAALYALHPTSTSFTADINRDGINETVLVTPQNLYVFSSSGGRLLYWFDLVAGEELIGNEDVSADYNEQYVNDNLALPLIRGGIETYPWHAGNPLFPEIFTWTFVVRKRALNDLLTIGGAPTIRLDNTIYSSNINGTSLSFSTDSGGITLRKEIRALGNGLSVTYHLSSSLSTSTVITHRIENSFSPSYLDVLDEGRTSLIYWDGGTGSSGNPTATTIGVRNTVTGNSIRYSWTNTPDELNGAEDVFSLELNPVYVRSLNAGDSISYTFSILANQTASGVTHGASEIPTKFALEQNYPNPFNPSTTIRFDIPVRSWIRLTIYNTLGQQITQLADQEMNAGYFDRTWNARVASGLYYYRFEAVSVENPSQRFVDVKKMILLK